MLAPWTVLAQIGEGGVPVGAELTEVGVPTPSVTWTALLPMIVLALGALVLLTVASLSKGRVGRSTFTLWTVVTGLLSLGAAVPVWARVQGWEDAIGWWDPATTDAGPFSTVGDAVGIDGFSVLLTMLIAAAVVVVALLADEYLRREGIEGPEFHVLVMLAGLGGMVMVSANDLIVLFLGLETLSIASYVLASMNRRRAQSQEAGLKYFVLGAFSSAFFLYGIAMVYGGTGSTGLAAIKDYLAQNLLLGDKGILLLLGVALLLVGFGFKIAAVPFHSWSPDVYDGAPSPAVAFMASVTKVAAFAGMVRVLVVAFDAMAADWRPVLDALAVLSLVGGALLAIVQTDVKRLLAYSSISHAGFILLGVSAASDKGTQAVVIYLVAYSFMVMGSFAVVALVGRGTDGHHAVADYRGLARSSPVLAGAFTFFLLAQAGVPFTAGFYAKFYAVIAAVDADASWLALVAMLSAVISAYLYLRLIVSMWFQAPTDDAPARRLTVPFAGALALGACVLVTLLIGLFPGPLTRVADESRPVVVRSEPAVASPLPTELTGG